MSSGQTKTGVALGGNNSFSIIVADAGLVSAHGVVSHRPMEST